MQVQCTKSHRDSNPDPTQCLVSIMMVSIIIRDTTLILGNRKKKNEHCRHNRKRTTLNRKQEENHSEQERVRAYAGKHARAYTVEDAYETRSVHMRTCHKWVHITINKYITCPFEIILR